MASDDRAAAELASIRADGYLDGPVPRLLAAVEAAQKHHHPVGRSTTHLCDRHPSANLAIGWVRGVIASCRDCTRTERLVCATCRSVCPDDDRWPCDEYADITRALTGEDSSDE